MENIKFTSKGITCSAWYIPATSDKYMSSRGRPCIIMANGFGGTKDTGLIHFAEPFSKAGFDTFIFDYRSFGESGGFPRQNVSYKNQREDYHAAIAAVRGLPNIDRNRDGCSGSRSPNIRCSIYESSYRWPSCTYADLTLWWT